MTGPQDPAAGGDRLMAGHADLEQVIEELKDALVQGRLTRDELGARAGRALAALTADIPAEAGPARPPAPARRRPLATAAARSGGCLIVAFAAMRFFKLAEPGGPDAAPYHSWAVPCLFVALAAVVAALFILGYGVGTSIEQRRSRRQLPPARGRAATPRCRASLKLTMEAALAVPMWWCGRASQLTARHQAGGGLVPRW